MRKITQFLREVISELKKVVWPSRQEALRTTWIVIAFSLIVALVLGLIDMGLTKIIGLIVG